jgi:nitric oxide reductase subunit C
MPSHRIYATVLLCLFTIYIIYSFWVYQQPSNPVISNSKKFAAGKFVWQSHNCHVCHQIYGLGGYLGPDLTNIYSKRGKDYIAAFVQNGTGVMPAFHLSTRDLNNLQYFLEEMDRTGVSDPRYFKIQKDGNIENETNRKQIE